MQLSANGFSYWIHNNQSIILQECPTWSSTPGPRSTAVLTQMDRSELSKLNNRPFQIRELVYQPFWIIRCQIKAQDTSRFTVRQMVTSALTFMDGRMAAVDLWRPFLKVTSCKRFFLPSMLQCKFLQNGECRRLTFTCLHEIAENKGGAPCRIHRDCIIYSV